MWPRSKSPTADRAGANGASRSPGAIVTAPIAGGTVLPLGFNLEPLPTTDTGACFSPVHTAPLFGSAFATCPVANAKL